MPTAQIVQLPDGDTQELLLLETRKPATGQGDDYRIALVRDDHRFWFECTCPYFRLSAANEQLEMRHRECKHLTPHRQYEHELPAHWHGMLSTGNALGLAHRFWRVATPTAAGPAWRMVSTGRHLELDFDGDDFC